MKKLVSTLVLGVALAGCQTAPTEGASTQAAAAPAAAAAYVAPRGPDGKHPDLNGVWQVLNTANFNIEAHPASAAMQLLEAAVQSGGAVVVRITFPSGAVRIFRGEPSLPGEDVQQGQIGTGSIDFAVKGFVLALAA